MAQQITGNTFSKGMIMDIADTNVATSNTVKALNATLSSFNGNEGVLQNDFGNVEIPNAQLTEGFIPIGSTEYGGIVYIVSRGEVTRYDAEGNKYKIYVDEIGSFPSPNWEDSTETKLQNVYSPLKIANSGNEDEQDSYLQSEYFEFDFEHPISILTEPSFDGSVNLIINDGNSYPKLINTGFHAQENSTYQIIKRYGTNNTNRYNIYDKDIFKIQTSLYRNTATLSKFEYSGLTSGGQLKVGNYVFYAVVCDKDGNESDIICESGMIPVFLGTDGDPFSISGGIQNELSDKIINFKVINIDNAYNYIKFYYSRSTSGAQESAVTLYYKIDKVYPVVYDAQYKSKICSVSVTGYETVANESQDSINIRYFNADTVKAQALNQNMLFMGNIEQVNGDTNETYEQLRLLSFQIVPSLHIKKDLFTLNYNYENASNSYYNSSFIYQYTGYHIGELYRFGIVYIRQDNSLTDVFNVLGDNDLNNLENETSAYTINQEDLKSMDFVTDTFIPNTNNKYNIKGVCRINPSKENLKLTDIIGIKFSIDSTIATQLKNLGIKGYFIVRQKRIPTLLAQGYATNICEESFLPSINTYILSGTTKIKSYLYESFIKGTFKYGGRTDYENFYPKLISTSNDSKKMGLVQNYESRLFTLTDNCYGYFDKYSTNFIASWWKSNVGTFDRNFLGGGTANTIYIMEGSKENGVVFSQCNEYGSSEYYWTTLYFAVEVTESNFNVITKIYENEVNNIKTKLGSDYTKYSVLADNIFDYANTFTKFKKLLVEHNTYWSLDDTGTYVFNTALGVGKDGWIDSIKQFREDEDGNLTYFSKFFKPSMDIETYADQYKTDLELTDQQFEQFKKYRFSWIERMSTADGPNKYGVEVLDTEHANPTDGIEIESGVDISEMDFKAGKIFQPQFFEYNNKYYATIWGVRVDDWTAFDDNIKEVNRSIDEKLSSDLNKLYYGIALYETNGYNMDIPTFDGKYQYVTDSSQDSLRLKYTPIEFNAFGILCPEYELNQEYYNNIFTGQNLKIKTVTDKTYLDPSQLKFRKFNYTNINYKDNSDLYNSGIVSVPENVSLMSINHNKSFGKELYLRRENQALFSAKAGEATEVGFKFVGAKFLSHVYPDLATNSTDTAVGINKLNTKYPYNIARGTYGAYLGAYPYYTNSNGVEAPMDISDSIVNIYIPNYVEGSTDYVEMRGNDPTTYQAISDRISLDSTDDLICYRGDCFINFYTHRLNRNFNDSTSPYNDTILDMHSFYNGFNCFSEEYRTFDLSTDTTAATKFNLGDINAVRLGSWITFPVRTSINTALRSEDSSWTSEKLQTGHNRSFYPRSPLDASGNTKIPESTVYNRAFSKSSGDREYVNIIKNVYNKVYYKNRILYSNILQQDSLTNGNRVFLTTHYKDYTDQYGEIVKLLTLGSNLLIICEHGILLVPVNERALAAESQGGNVYINTSNVLPDNPVIISDTYGSTWANSVILTPYGIFGIDVNSKKIWICDGSTLKIISDFSVQQFLNNYLKVSNTYNILNCSIKTHYNRNKNDVMFTLYDSTNDNYWNLCYNINQENWVTFYSWLPLLSENIGNCLITTDALNLANNKLWKHGFSNRIPTDNPKPTRWYGSDPHPFEFEFIVADKITYHKIFDNLQIISNNVAPESFHYEIIGDCYEFAKDKPNMYKRQELFKYVMSKVFSESLKYDYANVDTCQQVKSTMFPMYYYKKDIKNQIYDSYQKINSTSKNTDYNYDALSGTEVIYYPELDEFRFCNHVKGIDVKDFGSNLRGNMTYLEDIWKIQINPINLVQKNETTWKDGKIPIVINNIKNSDFTEFTQDDLPEGYTIDNIDSWDISKRKEVKLKDKYIKIRIRYNGDKLALISAIYTLYTISFT